MLRTFFLLLLFLIPNQSRAHWKDLPSEIWERSIAEYLTHSDQAKCFAVNKVMKQMFPIVQARLVEFAPISYFRLLPDHQLTHLFASREKPFEFQRALELHSSVKSSFLGKFFSVFEKKNLALSSNDIALWQTHGNRMFFMMYLEAALFQRFDERFEAQRKEHSDGSGKSLQKIRATVYPRILQAVTALTENTDASMLTEVEAVSQVLALESQSWPLSREFFRDVEFLEEQVDLYRSGLKSSRNFDDLDLITLIGEQDYTYSYSIGRRIVLRLCDELALKGWADEQVIVAAMTLSVEILFSACRYLLPLASYSQNNLSMVVPSAVVVMCVLLPLFPLLAHDLDDFAVTSLGQSKKIYESMYSATSPSDIYVNFEEERILTYSPLRPRPRRNLMFSDDILSSKQQWVEFKNTFFKDLSKEEIEYMKPWFSQLDRVQMQVEDLTPQL